MQDIFAFISLGLAAGVLSGLIGIGGGVIIVPALVFLFQFSQHRAEGTTLAMLIPPVGILAILPYYRNGYVDIRVAALICLGCRRSRSGSTAGSRECRRRGST